VTVAAVYARFSSDGQRDESIEIQVEHCAELIASHGWEMGEVYSDYAMTGRNDDRPGFQRMRSDMEAGAFDVLVVYKQDRLARNMAIASSFKASLFSLGVRLFSWREGEILDTPEGFLNGTIQDMFAEYYSRNLSVLVKDGIRKNAERCKANGQKRFGYRIDEDGYYQVDEAQAEVVRAIFSAYNSGKGLVEIAEMVNGMGVRTMRGNEWSKQTVQKTLRDDRFIGVYRYAGHVVEGGMPAIVSEEDFRMAQERSTRGAQSRPAVYALGGKAFCAQCGAKMTGNSGTGKAGRKYRYYMCSGKCGAKMARADDLERDVAAVVRRVLSDDSSIIHMTLSLKGYYDSLPDRRGELQAEIESRQERSRRLVESIAAGIDPSAVKDAIDAEGAAVASLQRELAMAEAAAAARPTVEDVEQMVRTMVELSGHDEESRRLLFDTYLDAVYVAGDGRIAVAFSIGDSTGASDAARYADARRLLEEEDERSRSSCGVLRDAGWWGAVDRARTPPGTFVIVSGVPPAR
jgi:DNA invertase Pin-like site-specific DNA recombinase